MTPTIKTSTEKKLVGNRLKMSLSENKTPELWKSFMPRRREIKNNLNGVLISMQVYPPNYFKNLDPSREFEKWAVVEVVDFANVPNNMETYSLPGGLYAMFNYKGPAGDPGVFQYIFQTWLPNSGYVLDDRPHFEVLGKKYNNKGPDSEEEIWIPISPKQETRIFKSRNKGFLFSSYLY